MPRVAPGTPGIMLDNLAQHSLLRLQKYSISKPLAQAAANLVAAIADPSTLSVDDTLTLLTPHTNNSRLKNPDKLQVAYTDAASDDAILALEFVYYDQFGIKRTETLTMDWTAAPGDPGAQLTTYAVAELVSITVKTATDLNSADTFVGVGTQGGIGLPMPIRAQASVKAIWEDNTSTAIDAAAVDSDAAWVFPDTGVDVAADYVVEYEADLVGGDGWEPNGELAH